MMCKCVLFFVAGAHKRLLKNKLRISGSLWKNYAAQIFLSRKTFLLVFFFFIMISTKKKQQAKQETFYGRKCQIRACLKECFMEGVFSAQNPKMFLWPI